MITLSVLFIQNHVLLNTIAKLFKVAQSIKQDVNCVRHKLQVRAQVPNDNAIGQLGVDMLSYRVAQNIGLSNH